jgi:hypothetical protein
VIDTAPAVAITLMCTVICIIWHSALEDRVFWTGNIQHFPDFNLFLSPHECNFDLFVSFPNIQTSRYFQMIY